MSFCLEIKEEGRKLGRKERKGGGKEGMGNAVREVGKEGRKEGIEILTKGRKNGKEGKN